MKKTFLTKRNALFSGTRSIGGYALAFTVAVLFIRLIMPNVFWAMMAPIFNSAEAASRATHSFLASFENAAALERENALLQEENNALTVENESLRQNSVSIATRDDLEIYALVVARPPESPYDTLVLNVGLADRVTEGMEVFTKGGTPIGVISIVEDSFSRATLFTSPFMRTSAWIGEKSFVATLVGAGGGAFRATVSRDAMIRVGDVVYVPGPGKLPAGLVARVDSDPSSPIQTLQIAPFTNLFSLGSVHIREVGAALRSAVTQATSTEQL